MEGHVRIESGDSAADIYVTIPGDTCSSIRLTDPDDESKSVVVALVFNERLCAEIADFIRDRFEQPENAVIQVKLEHVDSDMLARWVREE